MSKADLINFQRKYNLSDIFTENVASLFDKLTEFGYISIFKKRKLIEKFEENIQEVFVGTSNPLDYKTGFYDANKKTLYIKDEKDIPAIYLRVLYAITTDEIDKNVYSSGYMLTKLRSDSYKLEHLNFGLNRAVISNLVCKLCNMLPTDISILSTYNSYSHNFLGYTIDSGNNIYALEGKLLSELCFALNIDEQLFYTGLFSKEPYKYFESLLAKKDFKANSEFFTLFDETSRKYNTYNKLAILARRLNNNYLEFKKHALDEKADLLIIEKNAITKQIETVLTSLTKAEADRFDDEKENTVDIEESLTMSLNEKLTELEAFLKGNLVKMQDILSDKIIATTEYLTDYQYASRLKQFSTMLIVPNEKLDKAITSTILNKLLPRDEVTSVNLTVKVKYLLAQNILSENKYTSISKSFTFNIIPELVNEDTGVALALLNINGKFARLVQIGNLNLPLEKMNTSPSFIPLDNFQYLLNSDYSNMYVGFLEKIYTALRFKYKEFNSLRLNDLYFFEYDNKKYLIANLNNKVYVITVDIAKQNYDFKMLNISEQYSLFGNSKEIKWSNKSTLPVAYK
ncbi:MAG: hypothetical protein IKV94_01870 [Clostridia bacterium]|nr:hypothetical protein [Clostridia bacterium]